jgi:hypothetical protein
MLKIEDNLTINNARIFYYRFDTRATRAVKKSRLHGFFEITGIQKSWLGRVYLPTWQYLSVDQMLRYKKTILKITAID